MKVFRAYENGVWQAIGRADIEDTGQLVHEEPLFGPVSTIVDRYAIGSVTSCPLGASLPLVERGILLAAGQVPEFLPGWQPLAS